MRSLTALGRLPGMSGIVVMILVIVVRGLIIRAKQHLLVRYRVLAVGGGGVEDLSTLQIEAVRVLLPLAIHERAHGSVGGLLDSTLHCKVDRRRPRSRRGRWRLLPMVG